MGWATPDEEKLKLLEPVDYHAPDGYFDLAAAGQAPPGPVLDTEDGVVRMEVFSKILAGLVGQHVFLCACAIGGYQMKQMGLSLPGFVLLAALGAASVVYGAMWINMQGWPLNVVLLQLFTVCFGLCLADCVGTAFHMLPDLFFVLTLALALMLLYAMPSFCCDVNVLDIKHIGGIVGYCVCIGGASIVGLGAGLKVHPGDMHKAMLPVIIGASWLVGMLYHLRKGLGMYRQEHVVPQVIHAWVWPLDTGYIGYQTLERYITNQGDVAGAT